jgi:hypothetical protein
MPSDPIEVLAAFATSSPSDTERAAAFTAAIDQLVRPVHLTVSWGDRMLTIDKACAFMSDPVFRQCYEGHPRLAPL